MLGHHDGFDFTHDVRMLGGKVCCFCGIGLEVVEFQRRFCAKPVALPVAQARRLLEIGLVDFEIERVVQLRLFLAKQCRQNGDAVRAGRCWSANHIRRRRQKIHRRGHQVAGRAGLNLARPTGDKRGADAAFVERPLVTTQTASAAKLLHAFVVGAVIGTEHDQCVVRDAKLLEFLHQAADILVRERDHRGVILHLQRPRLV